MYMETQVRPTEMVSVKAQYVASANLPNGFFVESTPLKQLIQSSFDLEFSKDT